MSLILSAISARVWRWLSMVGVLLALLAGAVLFGWSKRGQVEAVKGLEGYKQTRKDMDDADPFIANDPDNARAWLRERAKQR